MATNKDYILIIRKGKKGKLKRIATDDPVQELLKINFDKIFEGIYISLETKEQKAERDLPVWKGRQVFNYKNKVAAYHLIKTMKWMMK